MSSYEKKHFILVSVLGGLISMILSYISEFARIDQIVNSFNDGKMKFFVNLYFLGFFILFFFICFVASNIIMQKIGINGFKKRLNLFFYSPMFFLFLLILFDYIFDFIISGVIGSDNSLYNNITKVLNIIFAVIFALRFFGPKNNRKKKGENENPADKKLLEMLLERLLPIGYQN